MKKQKKTHHSHEELVKPLQFKFSTGPHIRPEGSLHEVHTATGQQLTGGACYISAIIHLQTQSRI